MKKISTGVVKAATRPCTFTEIAAGTGLSLAFVSLIFNGRRRITPYAAARLARFFGISEELLTPENIIVQTPPARPLGRIVGRTPRHSCY
jgi:transcriptional regulator with XRE-family HTH domain